MITAHPHYMTNNIDNTPVVFVFQQNRKIKTVKYMKHIIRNYFITI